ncbi:hypothetical protein CYY_009850 [Polysphondylium violaceum]|uniref:F-box domain-containing protein n=1 Tax=Polysphondylium violaceum TaxID=133409 RepID=A0A8J4PKS4_9MYCE|nr:hypothetical protein CYY_009850 [Polysphondylium violaceum]
MNHSKDLYLDDKLKTTTTTTTTTTTSTASNHSLDDINNNSIFIQQQHKQQLDNTSSNNNNIQSSPQLFLYTSFQKSTLLEEQQENNSNVLYNSTNIHNDNDKDIDLISELPFEVLKLVFSHLCVEELLKISFVSKLFKDISEDFDLWKPKCRIPSNSSSKLNKHRLEKTVYYTESDCGGDAESYISNECSNNNSNGLRMNRGVKFYTNDLSPYPESLELMDHSFVEKNSSMSLWKQFYFQLDSITLSNSFDLVSSAIESSSCDEASQSIHNTLIENTDDTKFWSSKGAKDINSDEHLIYKLEQPISIVSTIRVTVYKAYFQTGMPIYSPQFIRISVGFSSHDMHYQSELYPVKQIEEPQYFYIEPQLVIGGYVRVDLIGRTQTQPGDGLYYTVLKNFAVDGIPIGLLGTKKNLLALSMIDYYSKFRDPNTMVHYNNANSIDQSVIVSSDTKRNHLEILLHLKSIINEKYQRSHIKQMALKDVLKHIAEGQYQLAITTIFEKELRSSKLFSLVSKIKDTEAICFYYKQLYLSGLKFSSDETLFLAKEAIESGANNIYFYAQLMEENRLFTSDALGDYLLFSGHPLSSAEVFNRCLIPDKLIISLFISGNHIESFAVYNTFVPNINISPILDLLKSYSTYQTFLFIIKYIEFSRGWNIDIFEPQSLIEFLNLPTCIQDMDQILLYLKREYKNQNDYTVHRQPRDSKLSQFFQYLYKSE